MGTVSTKAVRTERLWFLGTLTVGHAVVHWLTQLLFLALPFVRADLGLSNVQVGVITTSQQAASNATTLPLGYVSDSYRRFGGLMLAAAIVTFGLAYVLMAEGHTYLWALVGSALVGLGTALWHPVALGHLSLRFPDRRGLALSVHGVGASVGDMLAPIALGALIGLLGWRIVAGYHLLPALAIAVIIWISLRGSYGDQLQHGGQRPSFRSYVTGLRGMLSNRQVLAVMASNSLMVMARLSVLTFLPIYIKETLGYPAHILGIYFTLLYALGIVSQPLMGVWSDRFGRKWVLAPSFGAMGLLFLALGFAQPGLQLGLVIGALGLFFYAILNITQTAVMDVVSHGVQSSTMGMLSLVSQPFSLASPVIAGVLVTEFGIKSAFWYAAAAALLATAILIPVKFRKPTAPQS